MAQAEGHSEVGFRLLVFVLRAKRELEMELENGLLPGGQRGLHHLHLQLRELRSGGSSSSASHVEAVLTSFEFRRVLTSIDEFRVLTSFDELEG